MADRPDRADPTAVTPDEGIPIGQADGPRRGHVTVNPPVLVTMTGDERHKVVAAIARLLAELAVIPEMTMSRPGRRR